MSKHLQGVLIRKKSAHRLSGVLHTGPRVIQSVIQLQLHFMLPFSYRARISTPPKPTALSVGLAGAAVCYAFQISPGAPSPMVITVLLY